MTGSKMFLQWFPAQSPKTSYIEVADLYGMVVDALVAATGTSC